jgi:tRNA 2-thiouridine synthesizing protein B
MILHTLNASPSSAAFQNCLMVLHSGDAIVLMGDGVYAALPGTNACAALQEKKAEFFILGVDAALAGVTEPASGIQTITMDGLVELTEKFPRQQAWY